MPQSANSNVTEATRIDSQVLPLSFFHNFLTPNLFVFFSFLVLVVVRAVVRTERIFRKTGPEERIYLYMVQKSLTPSHTWHGFGRYEGGGEPRAGLQGNGDNMHRQ